MLDKKFSENKVPAIGALFWLTKLVSTGQGESISDFSAGIFGHGHQVMSTVFTLVWSIGLFVFFLHKQLRSERYHPLYYWGSVALLAVFGTILADGLSAGLGLSHLIVTLIFAVLMLMSFTLWKAITGSLSIHEIKTLKSESFYWLTVMFSFALGTAAGDWFAYSLGFGLLGTGLLLGAFFVVIVGCRIFMPLRENSFFEILTFWLAYALTRPVGASFADYFGYKWQNGFLGNRGMSMIWLLLFFILFGLTLKKFYNKTVSVKSTAQNLILPTKIKENFYED